jgi:type VII secretion-associated protein (TIGR03931 family)
MRVAVRLGGRRLLLASAQGQHGPRRLVPHAPTPSPADTLAEAAAAVRAVLGAAVADELLLVHPAHWSDAAVRRAVQRLGPLAAVVRPCPEPVALLRELDARALLAPGPLALLTADSAGIELRLFDDVTAATLLAARLIPTGPDPVEALGELGASLASVSSVAGLDPTELTGGVLLCWSGVEDGSGEPPRELLTALEELVGEPPRVLEDPGVAAVLGALRPAPRRWVGAGAPRSAASGGTADDSTASAWGDRVGRGLLGEPPARRWGRAVLCLAGVPLLAAVLTLLAGSGKARQQDREAPPARNDLTQYDLAQYDYALRLPAGWRHSGGLPERRRTLLAPAGSPDGSDLISVEQRVLGYDATREPERALAELRAEYERSRAGGAALSGLAPSVRFAGRDVATYQQHQPGRGTDVDWYVVFSRGAQLSVGCQHTRAGAASVGSACATVLRTLRLTS